MTSDRDDLSELLHDVITEQRTAYLGDVHVKWMDIFDFSQPVHVLMAITDTGGLSFYAEQDTVTDVSAFAHRAICQAIDHGQRVVGHFAATVAMGEFTTYTPAQYETAFALYTHDKQAEYDSLMGAWIDAFNEAEGDDDEE